MHLKKLFIYIPTYSRPEYLDMQLSALTSGASNYNGRVRILVSRNYDGGDYFEALKAKYSVDFIEFRENVGNIGGNANIMLGFVFANKNEYLWILSDDDLITGNAVIEILNSMFSDLPLYHIGEYSETFKSKLTLGNVFTDPKGAGFGLISSAIFSVDYFKDSFVKGFDFLESSFPHLAIILSSLRSNISIDYEGIVHKDVFTSKILPSHGSGDYSISSIGFGYLGEFFKSKERRIFVRNWLGDSYYNFIQAKNGNKFYFKKAIGYYFINDPFLFVTIIKIYLKSFINKFR